MRFIKKHMISQDARSIIQDLGLCESELLSKAELPDSLFDIQNRYVTLEKYCHFWSLLEEASGDTDFSLTVGTRGLTNSFNPKLFIALSCNNLYSAVLRLACYSQLIGSVSYDVSFSGSFLTVELRFPASGLVIPGSLYESELVFLTGILREIVGNGANPYYVESNSRGVLRKEYRDFFCTDVKHGSRNLIVFNPKHIKKENYTDIRSFYGLFEDVINSYPPAESIAGRLNLALFRLLPSGRSLIADMAFELAQSQRNLQRLLEREGTSYTLELKQHRCIMAEYYTKNHHLTNSQTTFLLGFSDSCSFSRSRIKLLKQYHFDESDCSEPRLV